jgi:hypothetical protein
MRIGESAKATEVSTRSLRYHEEQGLLPAERLANGYREYDEQAVRRKRPGAGGQQTQRFPYEDGVHAAQHLIHEMPADEFNKMLDLLNKHRESQVVSAN